GGPENPQQWLREWGRSDPGSGGFHEEGVCDRLTARRAHPVTRRLRRQQRHRHGSHVRTVAAVHRGPVDRTEPVRRRGAAQGADLQRDQGHAARSRPAQPAPGPRLLSGDAGRDASLRSPDLRDGIEYLTKRQFQERSPHALDQALEKSRESGMEALVLDLGNSPGGLLTAAVEVSEKCIDGGKLVVYTEGRVRKQN